MANFASRKIEKEALQAGLATDIFVRLPKQIRPDNYLICLKPNWKNLSFEGSEIVHLTILAESKEVVLNASDLTVGKIIWEEDVTENRQEPLEYAMDLDSELLKIIFDPPLNPSKGTLRINFSGMISNRGLKGVYKPKRDFDHEHKDDRTSEQLENHHDHHHEHIVPVDESFTIATSFEPTHARRCFPCFDEPAFKATFDLCLILPRDVTALSNMPIKVTYPHRSKKTLHTIEFRRTPIMSTYLLCFCIGKFDFVWSMTKDHLLCHVYTEVNRKKTGQLALDFLVRIVPYLNDYFELPYELPQLDIVTVADSFPVAMENWGLITFNEAHFMTDQDSSRLFVQEMKLKVALEASHQWFGNLVTMEWYSYLWLKEGFSTFMSYLAVDQFYPDFEIWSQFVCEPYFKALEADGTRITHPVETNVNNPSDIPELFDYLSFYKGAALIRMLYHYLGAEDFRAGVNLYLKRHQYKTATSVDLWKAFHEVSEKPVETIMAKWVLLPGFPIIKVSSRQDGNNRIFTLVQERFHGESAAKDREKHKEAKEAPWNIPITFASANKHDLARVIMDKKAINVSVLIGKAHWVTINPGQQGYFRVRYSPECFTQFLSAVRQKTLPLLDRLGLISDLFAFTQSGLSSTVEILSVLEAFAEETSYAVWKLIETITMRLLTLLDGSDLYHKYQSYVASILTRIEEKTTWDVSEPEGHLTAMRRTVILNMLVQINKPNVVQEAQKKFEMFQKGEGDPILPVVKIPVYTAALRSADEEIIRYFFKAYRDAQSPEEKDRIAKCLGAVRTEEKIRLVLDFSLSEDVRKEHSFQILSALSLSREGREVTWTFFKEHLSVFRHRFAGAMNRLVRVVTENFLNEEKIFEITDFFREHHVPGTERVVLLSCERIRLHDAWLKRDIPHIQDYLSSYP